MEERGKERETDTNAGNIEVPECTSGIENALENEARRRLWIEKPSLSAGVGKTLKWGVVPLFYCLLGDPYDGRGPNPSPKFPQNGRNV